MLTRIKIEKLFDQFDYPIEFKEEGITILTGPNGYGKTTILKIIDALTSNNAFFLMGLLFKKIVLEFSDLDSIELEKENENEVSIKMPGRHDVIHLNKKELKAKLIKITRGIDAIQPIDENHWLDRRTDTIINTEALFEKVLSNYPELSDEVFSIPHQKISSVYFIREQRLLRPVPISRRRHFPGRPYIDEETLDTFGKTIEEYAKELRDAIEETQAKSSQITTELDSSFPRRLFDQKDGISENDFTIRFDKVKETQKALSKYGLFEIKEDSHPTYKTEDAKALYVYIEDIEKKLAVFSALLEKLKVFTDILNKRRLTFKRINISRKNGFEFNTDQGRPLALGDLSSGEQQEVVMLYELLFKVQPGTLVLIDEPEISLHVVWQKQFLDDLFEIVKLQKINVIIATHSPQIINNHWDLTVDLEEISRCVSIYSIFKLN